MADLREGALRRGSKFFQFHAVFEKKLAKSYICTPLEGWRTHLGEILDPPLGVINGGIAYVARMHATDNI